MNEFLTLIYPIVAAVLLASYLYVTKLTGSNPEAFDVIKFSSTVIVGTGIAVFMYIGGSPISSEFIGYQLAIYSALIIAVENGIKIIVRTAVNVNITPLLPFLPSGTTPAPVPGIAAPAASSVALPAPVAPVAAVPVPVAAPVAPAPAAVVSPVVDSTGDHRYSLSGDGFDTVDKVAVKFYPAIIQGVSPLNVTVHAVADPAEGSHEVKRGIIDWNDGSAVETFEFSHGVARLNHTYTFVQRETFDGREPCKHYAHEYYPVLTAVSVDGLVTTINNQNGRSLIITCKDAEAVALGKVTNFPAPQ